MDRDSSIHQSLIKRTKPGQNYIVPAFSLSSLRILKMKCHLRKRERVSIPKSRKGQKKKILSTTASQDGCLRSPRGQPREPSQSILLHDMFDRTKRIIAILLKQFIIRISSNRSRPCWIWGSQTESNTKRQSLRLHPRRSRNLPSSFHRYRKHDRSASCVLRVPH